MHSSVGLTATGIARSILPLLLLSLVLSSPISSSCLHSFVWHRRRRRSPVSPYSCLSPLRPLHFPPFVWTDEQCVCVVYCCCARGDSGISIFVTRVKQKGAVVMLHMPGWPEVTAAHTIRYERGAGGNVRQETDVQTTGKEHTHVSSPRRPRHGPNGVKCACGQIES